MKKFKLNKTLFAVSVLVSSVGIANAQWSVKEVNSTAMKGTLEDMLDSLKT